ncbi:MAG: gliding motility-associated C-terminal domain-containing protein [Bacteroidales bacterium]|nr:gliding motility-associated C-terminal domain-containing protein [Bacteroidales bacterium]
MKLQEKFENYTRPVDEAGWEAISSDPALVRYNRGRLLRRVCAYGIPALVVTAALVTVLTLSTRHAESTATPQIPDTAVPAPQAESAPAPATAPVATTEANAAPAPAIPGKSSATAEHLATLESPRTATSVEIQHSEPLVQGEPTPRLEMTTPELVPTKPVSTPKNAAVVDNPPHNPTVETLPDETANKSEDTDEPSAESHYNFFVPNAFTPNNDGLNDELYVKANFQPSTFEIAIYNRRGELVYHSRDMERGWDGNWKGDELPGEVYSYVIKYTDPDGKLHSRKGQVVLIR